MADPTNAWWAYGFTGGASGDLDAIDGALLTDKDMAIVCFSPNGPVAFYSLDSDSGAVESGRETISPDTNPGNKRWIKGEIEVSNLRATDLTASLLLGTDASKNLTSEQLKDWVTGTANQVTVTDDLDGTITLSLPQNIDVNANISFGSIVLTGDYYSFDTLGSTGFGLRDNSGTLQLKDDGGSWYNAIVWEEIELDNTVSDGLYLEPDTSPYTGTTLNTGLAMLYDADLTTPHTNFWWTHYAYGIDFGSQKTVASLKCWFWVNAVTPTAWYDAAHDSFVVLKSNDNSTWSTVNSATGATFDGPPLSDLSLENGAFTLTFASNETARYFKVVFVDTTAAAFLPGGATAKITEIVATMAGEVYADYDQHINLASGKCINWGGTAGSSDGYGFWEDSGDIKVKHSGGSWYKIPEFAISAGATGDILYFNGSDWVNDDLIKRLITEIVINDDGSDIDFRVESSSDTHTFFIKGSSGNVGLGENSPSEMLHLTSSVSTDPRIRLENTNADANGARLVFRKTSASAADNDELFQILAQGKTDTGVQTGYVKITAYSRDITNANTAGRVDWQVKQAGVFRSVFRVEGYNGTVNQGQILFNVAEQDIDFIVSASGNTNAFFVQGSDGKIGIGNRTPAELLEVSGNIACASADYGFYIGTTPALFFRGTSSIAIDDALESLQAGGAYNIGIGYEAGKVLTTGDYNVLIGYQSGYSLTTGGGNFYMGYRAGYRNETGSYNVAVGLQAMTGQAGNSHSRNIALGWQSMLVVTTGVDNLALGYSSMTSLSSGDHNVGIGRDAADSITTHNYCTFIGNKAGEDTTQSGLTGIGYSIMMDNTTGAYNTGVGAYGLRYNQTGDGNTAVGYQALHGVVGNSFQNNVGIGYQSGYALTTGGENILIGVKAGDVLTTGTGNIIIGYNIDPTSGANASNELNIGNILVGDLTNACVRIGDTVIPTEVFELACASEDLQFINAGSNGATEQDWIEVKVGGVQGYIRVYTTK